MDIEYFERTMRKMYEAQALLTGLEDVKAGRVTDGPSALADLRSKYGL